MPHPALGCARAPHLRLAFFAESNLLLLLPRMPLLVITAVPVQILLPACQMPLEGAGVISNLVAACSTSAPALALLSFASRTVLESIFSQLLGCLTPYRNCGNINFRQFSEYRNVCFLSPPTQSNQAYINRSFSA